jgi:phosphoserine phosphatase
VHTGNPVRPAILALGEVGYTAPSPEGVIELLVLGGSQGAHILAEMVAEELAVKRWVANGLRFDRSGLVRPEGIGRVDPTRKDIAYKRLLKRMGIDSRRTIAVGDTVYDVRFLKTAAYGFMLAHTTRVDDPGIIHIEKLTDILEYV